MKVRDFSVGFLSLLVYELRRMFKGSFTSYLWFILLVLIATYTLFAENYVESSVEESFISFKYGIGPMKDIIVFISSFIISSIPDVLSGIIPDLEFPAVIGIMFFLIFPFLMGITLISKFIIKKSTAIIAGDKEKKTLYILVSSPQTRPSIYMGKFMGVFIMTLPMIFTFYFITNWAFNSLFPTEENLSWMVFKSASITGLLFASLGMLISVLWTNEEKATWLGLKIITFMTILTSIWIFIPVIELVLNLMNSATFFLLYLEKIAQISPFTLAISAVYQPDVAGGIFNIQIFSVILFLILGIVIFIRQDLEY